MKAIDLKNRFIVLANIKPACSILSCYSLIDIHQHFELRRNQCIADNNPHIAYDNFRLQPAWLLSLLYTLSSSRIGIAMFLDQLLQQDSAL